MRVVTLATEDDYDGWRAAARALAAARIAASEVSWQVAGGGADLFADEAVLPTGAPAFPVPRAFLALAETAILHRDPERLALLYALLLRLRTAPRALDDAADPLVHRLEAMARSVRRDIHKMHAFLRFREVATGEGPRFVAWFEPEHHIVRAVAGFFVRRFTNMDWSILTPELSLHWTGGVLSEGPRALKADAPEGDPVEAVWKTYYANIFNPSRLKVGAMLKEMPRKYWKNMPETSLIGDLVKGARARETDMVARSAASAGGNELKSWDAIRDEAAHCRRCHLYRHASRTVFGEGPTDAAIMFVGEQPGDQEDLAGRPFVGPAGQLFDRALAEAGIDRARTYVTNAVKHFKFERRGKRRIHEKPDGPEIQACRWWLDRELAVVRPKVIVALGATAGRALFGKAVTISKMRGDPHHLAEGSEAWVTVHPSFLLRVPDEERKRTEYDAFVADLKRIAQRAKALA
jgi:DNA polymerase